MPTIKAIFCLIRVKCCSSPGRLVAPMINTFFLAPMPSISVRTWLMTRSAAPPASPPPPPRALAIESNSSKNKTQGAAARALSNTSRTFASDSPNHMVSNSGPSRVRRHQQTINNSCVWFRKIKNEENCKNLWWKWSWPGTRWRSLWLAMFFRNQEARRRGLRAMESCRTWGTFPDARPDTGPTPGVPSWRSPGHRCPAKKRWAPRPRFLSGHSA